MKFFYKISGAAIALFIWLVERYENLAKKFVTFHKRPMYAKSVFTGPMEGADYSHCAIILQGPLLKEHDFTLETIRLYKKHFPQSLIIVSTWSDEDKSYVEKIKKEAVVLLNNKPDYNGPNNINFQIASTIAGITLARNRGADYILKTRADQRMYNPHMLASLVDLVSYFPVQPGIQQNKRFVGLSCGSRRGDYYRLSDMFLFGDADDMFRYWSADHIAAGSPVEQRFTASETHLFQEYIKRIGGDPKPTLRDSQEAYLKHCLLIDPSLVDWYWHKHRRHREFRYTAYTTRTPRAISFLEWFHLFIHNKNRDEK